jgi:hypothetical protein
VRHVAAPLDCHEQGFRPEDGGGEDVEREIEDLLVGQARRESLAAQQPDGGQEGDRQEDAVGRKIEAADVNEPGKDG